MTKLSTAEIIKQYNEMATALNLPTVKKFQDRATAEKRINLMLAKFHEANLKSVDKLFEEPPGLSSKPYAAKKVSKKVPVKTPEKTKASTGDKTLPGLVDFLKNGTLKGQKSATTLREALETFGSATRVQFKHSAIAAGFNGLSARNLFDRVNKK